MVKLYDVIDTGVNLQRSHAMPEVRTLYVTSCMAIKLHTHSVHANVLVEPHSHI